MKSLVLILPLILCLLPGVALGEDKVLLTQVKTLTLSEGSMTTGRRASRTSQLSRTGGSAPWGIEPRTVQCYNRGHDGVDVQWECKADLESTVELGRIEVTCEGYDYPDDPYILRGSCGLEYSLENRRGSSHQSNTQGSQKKSSSGGFNFADSLVLFVMALVAYALYRSCVSGSRNQEDRAYGSTNDDYHGRGGGGGWSNPGSGSSGAGGGFNSGLGDNYDNPSCRQGGTNRGSGYGGFWTGLGMGGLAGYMMGGTGARQRRDPNASYGGGSSFFGGGGGSSSSFGGGGSGGMHSSSGFGGTRRR
uniref:Store-operated calcium entry-associated regulatory factor n=1 Tax=Caligus rogercresseyi TaxID=217165 RepID=C1BRG4_CALRO|nr:Transmembrane protein 66 precursor [Caligus rogercresseyi]